MTGGREWSGGSTRKVSVKNIVCIATQGRSLDKIFEKAGALN